MGLAGLMWPHIFSCISDGGGAGPALHL